MAENTIPEFLSKISSIESGGTQNPYKAMGKPTSTGDVAIGKYQIMRSNIPEWSKAALGKEVTPDEFQNSPEIQEKAASHRAGEILKVHNPTDAAKVWFGGEGGLQHQQRKDVTGTTIENYGKKFENTGNADQKPEVGRIIVFQMHIAKCRVLVAIHIFSIEYGHLFAYFK